MRKIIKENIFQVITVLFMCAFILWSAGSYCAWAVESGAAMALTVNGKAVAKSSDGRTRALSEMSIIENGDVVTTDKDSSLKLVLFSTNVEYTLGGSSSATVKAGSVSKNSGSLSTGSTDTGMKMPRDTEINSLKLLGMVVRKTDEYYGFLYPGNNSNIISSPVMFRWKLKNAYDKVKFTLLDSEMNELLSVDISGNEFKLPPSGVSLLKPGGKFQAEVAPINTSAHQEHPADEKILVSFNVLSAEIANEVIENRQAMENQLLENKDNFVPMMKMMFVYLDHEMYPEVIVLGNEMIKFMPDNPNVYYFMSYAYRQMGMKKEEYDTGAKARELERELSNN